MTMKTNKDCQRLEYLLERVRAYILFYDCNNNLKFADSIKQVRDEDNVVFDTHKSRNKIIDLTKYVLQSGHIKLCDGREQTERISLIDVIKELKSGENPDDLANKYNGNKEEKKTLSSILALLKERIFTEEGSFLDYYTFKGEFDSSNMKVILYMDNMSKKSPLYDAVFVYIQQLFHAYYSLGPSPRKHYVEDLEELMSVFGALAFLEKMKDWEELNVDDKKVFEQIFENAKDDVEDKRHGIGSSAVYGFGRYVFDHCANKEEWLLEYSKKSMLLHSGMPLVAEFVKRVYPFYPIKEHECFKMLELLLFDKNCSKYSFEHFDHFHTVAFRILLLDDKVGSDDLECKKEYTDIESVKDKGILVKKCDKNESCVKRECKLCTIKRLMDNGIMEGGKDGKKEVFLEIGKTKDYFYWEENDVECYYCTAVIKDFIDDVAPKLDNYESIKLENREFVDSLKQNTGKSFYIPCDFEPNQKEEGESILRVQIIGVRDVRTALLLLSRYKFDMLFVDYLLDKKNEGGDKSGREYSIQLFEFLSKDYEKEAKNAEKENNEIKKNKYKLLEKLCRTVRNNRGPLDKFWIMPITGFNSPFIQTLQNNNVPLISSRWHIDNGADPITTPWQFLVKLNRFIELQLKGCVYDMDTLLQFLTISGTNIKRRLPLLKDEDKQIDAQFHDFQDILCAEYSNFMKRFGARPLIRRDAFTDEKNVNYDNMSVFSTYIWRKFYTDMDDDEKAKRDKKLLFSLHNLMQIFYQVAATMPQDRNGVLRLREAFRRLRYYVDINDLKEKLTDKNRKDELDVSLDYFAKRIDLLLVEKED